MKRIAFILFAALLSMSGSASAGGTKTSTLHVVFLRSFENEYVELSTAGKSLFGFYLHTEPTSGTAGNAEVAASNPTTQIEVRVPRLKISKVTAVALSNGSYLYVSLSTSNLSFQQTKTPLALD